MKKLFNSGIFQIVIGIIIATIFYILSSKDIEPVYSIKKAPSLIYDITSAESKLKLIAKDSTIIDKNVYVITLVIWNNGNKEIKKEDVRKKLKFYPSKNGRILDYKLLRETNPEISKFSLNNIDNEVHIDWEFFDPGFGLEFQIIYSADNAYDIALDGYFLGSEIKQVQNHENILFHRIFLIVSIAMFLYCAQLVYKEYKIRKFKEYQTIFIVMILMLIIVFMFSYLNFKYPNYNLPL